MAIHAQPVIDKVLTHLGLDLPANRERIECLLARLAHGATGKR